MKGSISDFADLDALGEDFLQTLSKPIKSKPMATSGPLDVDCVCSEYGYDATGLIRFCLKCNR